MSTERWLDYQPRHVRPATNAETQDIGVVMSEHNVDWQQPQPPTQLHHPSNYYRLSRDATPDGLVVACLLRVVSACIASAVIAVTAVTYVLGATFPSSSTSVDRHSWVIGIPVGGTALAWQLIRLGILATGCLDGTDDCLDDGTDDGTAWATPLLAVDIVVEALLAVGSVICAILAGFQAARHGRRHKKETGCEIALSVLLGLLAAAAFGVLAGALAEEHRRRLRTRATDKTDRTERRRFRHSSNSSVIEIIRQ